MIKLCSVTENIRHHYKLCIWTDKSRPFYQFFSGALQIACLDFDKCRYKMLNHT